MTEANKKFYRSFFTIVVPIALQQLITSALSVADTLMLGYVSQTALAASSLAGQIQFVLNMIFLGLSAGITILAAQYWGKGDLPAVEKVFSIGLKLSLLMSIIFFIGAVFFPTALMRIYTNEAPMIEAGAEYLRIVGWSYLAMGMTQPYLSALKSVDAVKASTLISTTALGLNIFLNAAFIFAWFPGIPPLGITGVALATLISRIIELILCILFGERFQKLRLRPRVLFLHSRVLWKDFIRYSLPAIGNEFVWGLAFSMYSVIMGHLGEDIVAANSIVSTMRNLTSAIGFGVAGGTTIILGNTIGRGDIPGAERDAKRLLRLAFVASLIASAGVLIGYPILLPILSLTEQAGEYLRIMVWISAVYVIGPIMNTALICGVFRAGGDSKFGLICDIIAMWCVFVPLGFIAAFVLKLPPILVYVVLSCDEFAKMPVVYFRYRQKKWLRNITKDVTE